MKHLSSPYGAKKTERQLYFALSGVKLDDRWILMGGPDPDMIKMIDLLEAKHIKVKGEIS